MKNFLSFAFSCAFICACSAGILLYGYGKAAYTVTSAPSNISFYTDTNAVSARTVSVYNSGTAVVYCAINCTTSVFTNMLATTNAIGIPPNMIQSFVKTPPEQVNSLCVGTLGPTSVVYISAY